MKSQTQIIIFPTEDTAKFCHFKEAVYYKLAGFIPKQYLYSDLEDIRLCSYNISDLLDETIVEIMQGLDI
jgi:hypothetical protein